MVQHMARTPLTLPFSGALLRKQRELKGWRQQDLSDRSGVAREDISRYETGSSLPSATTFGALVKALACAPTDLLDEAAA